MSLEVLCHPPIICALIPVRDSGVDTPGMPIRALRPLWGGRSRRVVTASYQLLALPSGALHLAKQESAGNTISSRAA